MTAATDSGVVFPPENLDALLYLARFLELHTEPALLLGPDGEQAPLPEEGVGADRRLCQPARMRPGRTLPCCREAGYRRLVPGPANPLRVTARI